ncbi:MAG: alpha-1,2-fucosyltransferase, partial [Verrucomicrobiaceae bacterium]
RISAANSVAVHVRRGDYVSNSKAQAFHGTLSPDWYTRAKTEIERRISGRPTYFVFSDDAQWARRNLDSFAEAVFIPPPSDGGDAQDLHLMALCKHQIIANSSFSWWGAWLNKHQDKCVVAPRSWFRSPRIDTSDLIPSDWLRI